MRFLNDQGFVLKRINFGDSDRYITLFSKHHGKVELIAKGVRKLSSRRSSSVEPLNLIEFQSVKTAKNYILTEVKLVDSFEHLKTELENIRQVFLICEMLDAVLPPLVKHPEVFDLVERAALKVSEDAKNMAYFQANLLSLLGFWDNKYAFKNPAHVQDVFEQIIERKLKSSSIPLT